LEILENLTNFKQLAFKNYIYFMAYLEFCSNCGKKNKTGEIDGGYRAHCIVCKTIHYENPKPTATLICMKNKEILLVKRAKEPGKGMWGLPGGFIERGETLAQASQRELYEETNLIGYYEGIVGTYSEYNTLFGDILLIGVRIRIDHWTSLKAGDDASDATLFPLKKIPKLAFISHEKILNYSL